MPVRSLERGAGGPSPGHPGQIHTLSPGPGAAGVRVTAGYTCPGGGINMVRSPR